MAKKLTCPECNQPITPKTTKCPHCKRKVSQKYLHNYLKIVSISWFVGLGCFLLFLIIPFIFYDYIGGKWTGIIVLSGIPISIFVGYLTRKLMFK
ncbi:MAG TPA: hypothetical protein PLJ33_04580 [Peptococcaceae bacterium]|jgi:hypothetical protein|nr:hypothetical protein [Peptococcaceae bacterium]HPZ71345.1 hypothetical protein [Peptococcaceae bacterium]HQD54123.1 hypothetical protein [Peptococcaceae bacterium]